MEEYKERVIVEKAELDKKIDKLHQFLVFKYKLRDAPRISPMERWRMSRQELIMKQYSDILADRISNWS